MNTSEDLKKEKEKLHEKWRSAHDALSKATGYVHGDVLQHGNRYDTGADREFKMSFVIRAIEEYKPAILERAAAICLNEMAEGGIAPDKEEGE